MATEPTSVISECSICGSKDQNELFEARDRFSGELFAIARCDACSVLMTIPYLNETQLADYYQDDYWGESPTQDWIIRSQAEKLKLLSQFAAKGGNILDVGAGSGYFLRALDAALWTRFAVENGNAAAEELRKHLDPDHLHEGAIQDATFPKKSFDVITFWSALEHMNDPRSALNAAHRMLRSNGSLIIQLPNAASYQLRLFKGNWFALDVPRHRYHFSRAVLERLLNETGFVIKAITYRSKEHNVHALRQSMKGSFARSAVGRILYLLLKPLTRPIDHLLSMTERGATITLVAAKADRTLSISIC